MARRRSSRRRRRGGSGFLYKLLSVLLICMAIILALTLFFRVDTIEVNGELQAVEQALNDAVDLLNPGGRVAVISFHSLEDRIVKQVFAQQAKGCVCPPEFPVCVCGKKPRLKLLHKGVILPSQEEMEQNPRARSAKLRSAEKL